MTKKQQCLIIISVLLLLSGLLAGALFLRQREPELPRKLLPETSAVSSETSMKCIESNSTETGTTAMTSVHTSAASVSTAVHTSTSAESTTTTADTTAAVPTTTTASTAAVTTSPASSEVIHVESISLTFYEVQLHAGETVTLGVTLHPANASDTTQIWSTSDNNVASFETNGSITGNAAGECIITVSSASDPEVSAQVRVIVLDQPTEPPCKSPAPLSPTYIGGILIVNKTYPLPADYNPGLDPSCSAQFDALSAAAAAEGLDIYLSSGFRSYERQKTIYSNYLKCYGQKKTDTLSARAGHSEHQSGLAIDVNSITDAFGSTPEAAWLAEHAHEFGFIIRYPKGKEHITGYKYEPWHIRYLGVETAAAVYASGLTLEEYLGVTSCYADCSDISY